MSDGRVVVGYTDPNFPNPNGQNDALIVIYGYTPNFVLCILGIVLFAIGFVAHSFQIVRYKTWTFIPLAFACLMEAVGYAFRALSSKVDPYSVIYFVVQYFLIVVAPVFISASIYICLSKLIRWAEAERAVTRERWFLRPKPILWTFILADVGSTILQIAGAAMIGSAESNGADPSTPNHILLAGLVVQTFAFTVFLALLSLFLFMLTRGSKFGALKEQKGIFVAVLSVSSLLVYLRTIFRLAETSQGVFGYLSSHEGFFAGLEFVPIVVAVWLLAAWFPGKNLASERVVKSSVV